MTWQTGGDILHGQFVAADVQRIIRCRAIETFYSTNTKTMEVAVGRVAVMGDIHDQPWYTKTYMKRRYLKKLRALGY